MCQLDGLSRMPYKVEVIKSEDNGERVVLVLDESGMPHDLISRYLLRGLFNRSSKTILNQARNICQLYQWGDELGINIEERIYSGEIFGITEIDSLVRYLSLNRRQMRILKGTSSKDTIIPFAGYVTADMQKQKIDDIARYFKWIGSLSLENRSINDPFYTSIGPAMDDLKDRLDALKVRGSSQPRVGLKEDEQQFLISITSPNNKNNPFEHRTRVRNHLIFKMLLLCGARLGELLSLKPEQCKLAGDSPYIIISQNTTKHLDPRKLPPESKTLSRRIYITPELASDIDSYINNERKARGKAAKRAAPYLFLNTWRTPSPMTQSAVQHMCKILRERFPDKLANLHPHRLRHTFNDNLHMMFFNKMGNEAFLKMQRWLNGWVDDSEQGYTYTHLAMELQGKRMLIHLQESIMKGDYEHLHINEY